MKIDLDTRTVFADGTVVCKQSALVELLYADKDIAGLYCDSLDDEQEWNTAAKICDTDGAGPVYTTERMFDGIDWRNSWLTPEPWASISVLDWCLARCSTEQERVRVHEECAEMQQRNMLGIVRHLIFCVDTWRAAGIVWGVGRGSSVCSYVLFLVGINRINPLEYDLDLKEWLK
jgi:Bacterial DNA polymerase III alpha NTPase domain